MNLINVAVIGMGYWGPNLARNFAALPGVHLHSVCDVREEPLRRMGQQYPKTRLTTEYRKLLDDPAVDAVVVATPAETHYALAKESMDTGKHVLVEKPLAMSASQCRDLIDLAELEEDESMSSDLLAEVETIEATLERLTYVHLLDVRRDCLAVRNLLFDNSILSTSTSGNFVKQPAGAVVGTVAPDIWSAM